MNGPAAVLSLSSVAARAVCRNPRSRAGACVAAAAVLLGGCAGASLPKLNDLNPWKEVQQPLPGKRIPVVQAVDRMGGADLAAADKPIIVPAAVVNEDWTQPGGTPANAPGNLALGAQIRQVWSADAGTGSGKMGRVSAAPIVYGGRIFTIDAKSQVSAFSTGGALVWRSPLAPSHERDREGYGGGLAADGGRVYAASGFGSVTALDPTNGKKLWEKNLGVPLRISPTASGERVYVLATDGRFFCLSGADGSELWSYRGLPDVTRIISNPSPAVDGEVAVVPYSNGDIVAVRVADGQAVWQDSLARLRVRSSLAAMSDASRPVMSGGIVYAVGHSGRMIATRATDGERLWALEIPGIEGPVVAGETVYVVDTAGQMLAINKSDGRMAWTVRLPGPTTWAGPVLAGGNLWAVSSKGNLVAVDAATGRVTQQLNVGQAVYVAPIVAQGRLYVLTDQARLIAYN